MVRYRLIGLVAGIVVAASLVPGDASAFNRGGGGRVGGGFHGGVRAGGGGMRVAGGYRPAHPIAGRPGGPIAGRPGRPIAGYPGRGYAWRGAAYGAAAAGAAAAGLYGYSNTYNNNGCYQDPSGNWVCPGQYQGQYPYNGY